MRYHVNDVVQKIKDTKIIEDFLEDLTPRAKNEYLIVIAEFCKVNTKTPLELITIAEQEQKDNTPIRDLSIRKWFKNYEKHSEEYNRSSATYQFRVHVVKGFFADHEITIPPERHRRRKKKKQKFSVKNKRERLTPEFIREFIKNTSKVRETAMILTQCSSGLSLTDLLNLTLDEYQKGLTSIGEGGEICRLHYQKGRSKTESVGNEFYTFISFEGVEAINRYLKYERNPQPDSEYLFSNSRIEKQLSTDAYMDDLRRLNRRMKLKRNQGEYHQVTSHMFRKFFNTQLANTEMSYEARKTMMGHVVPGVDDNYYLTHPDDLMQLYVKYMPVLLIYEYESVNIVTTDEKIEEIEQRHAKEMEREKEKHKDLEKRLNRLEDKLMEKYEDDFEKLPK